VEELKKWDLRASVNSVATTLAIEWGSLLVPKMTPGADENTYEYINPVSRTESFIKSSSPEDLLLPLQDAVKKLTERYGKWEVPWGDINRFQRASSDIIQNYTDNLPSLPVAFTSATWGMLPSYSATYFPGTNKRYGVHGNSFVCAVEFGEKVKAKSLLAGGQSGDPRSPHFADQSEMYSKGIFKDVLFYKEDVLKHVEKKYHPGSLNKKMQ
jgi:acyl-homoserine lactone acylase PvdQ